jgi:GH25 family lysozyme M1 (1,4-beta-N-acetylmuramidase)
MFQKRGGTRMAGTPQFVDISAFQGAIDFSAYCAWAKQWDGIARIAMKSSEGVGFTDPRFTTNRANALAAGIDCIYYYHFARPDLGNAAISEANWQRQVVGDIRSQDLVILDYEVETNQATSEWAYTWLQQQESNYNGKLPGIYASSYYIQQRLQDGRLARYPLWLANWQYTPDERPAIPAPWSSYEFVQYTDRATNIPGIAGNVDANIFLGAGGVHVNNYGPGKGDFDQYFTVNSDGNWTCKQTGAVLIGGNRALYSQLSIDGLTVPIVGLPLESEQYHHEQDGYNWSSQQCERATIYFDPDHHKDSQPGLGASYLAHINPPKTIETVPGNVKSDIVAVNNAVAQLTRDAGL